MTVQTSALFGYLHLLQLTIRHIDIVGAGPAAPE